ncbi:MAG: carbon-nitrogen family hydrolase [Desulfococcaceae bacterium]
MHIAAIQMAVVEDDKNATIAKARERILKCRGADLVILPELWNIGFMSFDRYHAEAEDRNGPTLTAMRECAREIGAWIHAGSFVEWDGDRFYNTSFLLKPDGEIAARYRKIHLFPYNSRENELLTPGEEIAVADTPLGRFGLATCFDLRFPELFRRMVEAGAEFLLICSAWPYPRLEHWLLFNRVRALENQCVLVSANSVGTNRDTRFVGNSMIVDPMGAILAGGGDGERIVRGEIGRREIEEVRDTFPALAARREWVNLPADRLGEETP